MTRLEVNVWSPNREYPLKYRYKQDEEVTSQSDKHLRVDFRLPIVAAYFCPGLSVILNSLTIFYF